jgi:hypothetical protein
VAEYRTAEQLRPSEAHQLQAQAKCGGLVGNGAAVPCTRSAVVAFFLSLPHDDGSLRERERNGFMMDYPARKGNLSVRLTKFRNCYRYENSLLLSSPVKLDEIGAKNAVCRQFQDI